MLLYDSYEFYSVQLFCSHPANSPIYNSPQMGVPMFLIVGGNYQQHCYHLRWLSYLLCQAKPMKSLLRQKIVDLDLKLPQLSFLINKKARQKSYTERKSKEREMVIKSDHHIYSVMKKRYDIPRAESKKQRDLVKNTKDTRQDSPQRIKKILTHVNHQPSRLEPVKQLAKKEAKEAKEAKESKLLLFRNMQSERKRKKFDLGDLLMYNQTKYGALPNIKTPRPPKKTESAAKVEEGIAVPCKYGSVQLISQLDFLRLFILEQLIYFLSQSISHNREEMVGFCRIYLENCDRETLFTTCAIYFRRQVVEEALILQKLAVYVVLLLSNQEVISKETSTLMKSISSCIHKNNLILLDLLMLIGEYEGVEITSQFHIFNTMRFNESRRRISYSQDGIQLVKQNNATLKTLLDIITKASKFDSLNGFVQEVVEEQTPFAQKLDDVLFVLYSFHQVLTQSETEELQKPEAPYLTPTTREYTLVLDLDETLIHTKEIEGNPHFLIRPYCHEFLRILSEFYQIVIFTASVKHYADTILDILDKDKYITSRLYRQHTRVQDYTSIKDLSLLGRDLSKTIIIDNIPSNFKHQPRNGIYIATWTGNQQDCCLLNLIPVLELLVKKKATDVRDGLEAVSKHMEQVLRDNCPVDLGNVDIE